MIPPSATGDLGLFFCRIWGSFRVLGWFDSTLSSDVFLGGGSVQNNTAADMQPGARNPQVWSAHRLASQLASIISSLSHGALPASSSHPLCSKPRTSQALL